MYTAKSTCRSCLAYCPLDVTIDNGRVIKVDGNPEAPLYGGYTCPKGRALSTIHNDPNRLMHSLKRMPDGSFQKISNEQLVEEVSEKLRNMLAEHGSQAVAVYFGSPSVQQQACGPLSMAFLQALGSDRFFSNSTIDQPGAMIADAVHGTWAGGHMRPDNLDVFMIVGGNPVVSKQYFPQNPGQQLKDTVKNGTRLIVIDPRRTETARRAHIHLQCIPGEDPTIIAGLIHLVILNGNVSTAFVDLNANGLSELTQAVKDFTPEYVSERAGIAEADLREAARIIGKAKTGDFGSGVGPSMSTRGTLTAYLILCLQTLRGFWAPEGAEAVRPRVLLPRIEFKAQPNPTRPGWGFGRKMRIRGLQETAAGMPTGALPEEIIQPGDGQIRALFLHSGAMLTWPDEARTKEALAALDLLIVHDVEASLSPTARMAHYVIATNLQFEMPTISQYAEVVTNFHQGYGWVEPYAAYNPALIDPPSGSDLMESWQIYYRVGQKLGLRMRSCMLFEDPQIAPYMDMGNEPTTDEIYEAMCRGSTVPLDEVKRHPNGKIFDQARAIVGPRDPDCTAKFELAHPTMLEELSDVRHESIIERRGTGSDFPFLYITRRVQNSTASSPRPKGILKTPYNPAYLHPADIEKIGIKLGDMVEIRSKHGVIVGIVQADEDLRPGVLSMAYGFGRSTDETSDPHRDGSNVNRLLNLEDDYDPYCGIPRMSAVPVAIKRLEAPIGQPAKKTKELASTA